MGVQSDLILARADAAEDIRASDSPSAEWDGFSFKGMDNVKIAMLLSLLSSQSPSADFGKWLDAIPTVGDEVNGPWVFTLADNAVDALAAIASKEDEEFGTLAKSWGANKEFEGWEPDEVNELLRSIGDLAETATLEKKSMFLWVSL
ncbi:MAG: hypothetical protein R3B84_16835 [Zavarzinella sp.]